MSLALRRRIDHWLFQLRGPQSGPIVLVHRRVYILPVSHGYVYLLVLLIMLTGSINYSLSLGFVLTFLLAGLAINGILYTFRNLANLRVMMSRPRSVFAGQSAEFPLRIENPTDLVRASVEISHPGVAAQSFDIAARNEIAVFISLPAEQRGLLPLGRVMVLTRYPLGLFRAWSYAEFDVACMVYPKPEPPGVPLPKPAGERGEGATSALGTEDYSGLRPYHAGDSPRRIAWKADAREQGLLTKVFSGRAETHLWLDWASLPGELDMEARLARLTRWVLDADAIDSAYGLRLPGVTIDPASGTEHRTHCLETLALFDPLIGDNTQAGGFDTQASRMSAQLDLRNVAWMALSMALVTLPHMERLPLWLAGVAMLAVAWRIHIAWQASVLPKKWLLLLIVAAATAGIYLTFGTLFGRDSGVALLIAMLTLKLLEMATLRDAMIVIFLSYFVVLTTFLYSQTIPTALLMLVGVWVITATMIGLQWRPGAIRYQETLRLSGVMLLQATPLMLVLFLLFPRIQGPLWGLPRDAFSGVTGLSDSMSPGTLSQLTLSDAVAFRVQFQGDMPKPNQLYWRGPVLWYFDGVAWHMGLSFDSGTPTYSPGGAAVSYAVTLEPHDKRWLFALDLPAKTVPGSRITADYQMLAGTPVRQRVRYEMTSHTSYRVGYEGLSALERRRSLQLPEGYNWRSRALAQNMRRAARDERAMIDQVLGMFRTQQFFYTLSPPLLGENPIDDFLFNTRSGFCEHYASAFVFLMRASNIPARVVTGYQGGELNPIGNYMIVRQSEAHAWAEVWLEDAGWIRVDPTAAVSPLRVESGIAAAIPASDALPLLVRSDAAWLRQLRFTWDSVANSWNQWVLGYNPDRQFLLLSRVGLDRATWQTLAMILVAATGLITAVFAAAMLRRLSQRTRDPVAATYARFCRKLARRGAERAPSEGPADFADRAARQLPDAAAAIRRISELYIKLRYGRLSGADSTRQFRQLVANLRL